MTTPIEVLLVEDNPAEARLTTEALRDPKIPYHLHIVQDGEEALQFLHQERSYADAPRPDLVLLDLNLPKVDGREVLATIKADVDLTSIPVIVLTCSDNPQDVADAYRHHVAGYITKRADLNEYFSAIRLMKQFWFNVITLPPKARAEAEAAENAV